MAAVSPAQLNPAGDTAIMIVTPTTGPQDTRTEDLVRTLRADVSPQRSPAAGPGARRRRHRGGHRQHREHLESDPAPDRGVVLLSFLLLLVSSGSIAVAVKAAVMNLLSVAAAYGVVALVLQGGWAGRLIGIDHPTPLPRSSRC